MGEDRRREGRTKREERTQDGGSQGQGEPRYAPTCQLRESGTEAAYGGTSWWCTAGWARASTTATCTCLTSARASGSARPSRCIC
eukprot:726818-Rhodomonas_salina.1